MKEKFDYIDKLVKNSLQDYEVSTNLKWSDIESRINSGISTTKNFVSTAVKAIVGTAIVAGGILAFYGFYNSSAHKAQKCPEPYIYKLDTIWKPYMSLQATEQTPKKHLKPVVEYHLTKPQKTKKSKTILDTVVSIIYETDTVKK